MKIQEYLEGSGIYTVPKSQIAEKTWFVRDPKMGKSNEVGPLLHICNREDERGSYPPMLVIMTDVVRWDFWVGHYYCTGCKETWSDEEGLRAIWEDGYGTGDEVQA